jgi:protein TonB
MQMASPSFAARVSEWQESPRARRVLSFLIVVAVHILLAFVLLTMTPQFAKMAKQVTAMELLPDLEPPAAKSLAKKAQKPVDKPQPPTSTIPPPIVKMERPPSEPLFEKLLFDAVDISKLPNRKSESAAAAPTGDSAVTYGPGAGPGGVQLFVAEWVREPTDAELAFYVKDLARNGAVAIIACRTVARNKVEDCQVMDEQPRGSGLGRALAEAAWQFRVRPPRLNGEPQVGTWVQIRFTFTVAGVSVEG